MQRWAQILQAPTFLFPESRPCCNGPATQKIRLAGLIFARIVRIPTSYQCSRGPASSAHQRFKAVRRIVCIHHEQEEQVNLEIKKVFGYPRKRAQAFRWQLPIANIQCSRRPVISISRFCWEEGSQCSRFPTKL